MAAKLPLLVPEMGESELGEKVFFNLFAPLSCVKLWDERKLYSHCKLPQAWQKFDSMLSSNGRIFGERGSAMI